jgi:Tol biopolymer transport system component
MRPRLSLVAGCLVMVLLLVGCELEKSESTSPPPPPPQPAGDVVNDLPVKPSEDRIFFSSGRSWIEYELYSVFSDGSGRKRLTRDRVADHQPTVYPDSAILYLICDDSQICVTDSAGNFKETVSLGLPNSWDGGPDGVESLAISPDGQRMAITTWKTGPRPDYLTSYDLYMHDFTTEETVNLAVGPSQDRGPAWVTGDVLVWSRLRQGDYELVTFDLSGTLGGAPAALTDNDADDIGVDVSPDGSTLSFLTAEKEVDGSDERIASVNIMPFTGGVSEPTALQLVRFPRDISPGGDGDTAWSPDGGSIAYSGYSGEGFDIEVFSVPVSGGAATNVSNNPDSHDFGPDWAVIPPAFSVGDPQTVTEGDVSAVVFRVKLDVPYESALSVRYTTVAGTATEGSDFTPRSGTLDFAAGETEKQISVPIVDDSQTEPLETLTMELSSPSGVALLGDFEAKAKIADDELEPSPTPTAVPSPSGSASPPPGEELIVYQNENSVWAIDPDGSNPRQLLASGASPDLRPGGSTVVVSAPAPSTNPDIHTLPVTGGATTRINGTSSYDGSPSWAPDGEGVAWVEAGSSLRTRYASPPTAPPLQLPPDTLYPDWGEVNGDEVIAVSVNGELRIYEVATGTDTGMTLPDGIFPAISPDGTKLAFSDDLHGDMDIFVQDLTDLSEEALHLTTSSAQDTNPVWSPDGEELAFVTDRGGDKDIYKMEADVINSEVELIATPADEAEPSWGGGAATLSAPDPAASPSPTSTPAPSPDPLGIVIPILGWVTVKSRRRNSR